MSVDRRAARRSIEHWLRDQADRARGFIAAVSPRASRPPIAIFSFNRPHYLSRVLQSLNSQAGGLAGREIHFFQDGAVNAYSGVRYARDEEIEACLALRNVWLPQSTLHLSSANIGIAENFLRAERFLFEERGADVAYFFEDDMELGEHYLSTMDMVEMRLRRSARIGHFAVYGQPLSTVETQYAQRRSLMPLGHHWAFGLRRETWRAMQPILASYYGLVAGADYRHRPDDAIREQYRRTGLSHPATSQDGAKAHAIAVLGFIRCNTYPCFAKYIGEVGVHWTPAVYAEARHHETVLYPYALPGIDIPTDQEISARAEGDRAFLRQVWKEQEAIEESRGQ